MVTGFVGTQSFVHQYTSPPGSPLVGTAVAGYFVAGAFPFVYGQPFLVTVALAADSGTVVANAAGDICVFCTGSGFAVSAFNDTFVLSGFEALDSNGNPLPSAPTITSASGTQYSENGVLASFANLSVKDVDLKEAERKFYIKGSFSLGTGSKGIDPPNQDVGLQIGTFSTVVPVGSFKRERRGNDRERYRFDGTINGVRLEVQIQSLSESKFRFEAEGHGADLTGTVKPITIKLMIGGDGGTTTFNH